MQLKDYIQGNKRGKDANRLEREAMNDPFLQGALDGFDSVAGNHAKIIKQLEEKYTHPVAASQPEKRKFFYWAAAAAILLLIGFGSYFLLEKNKQNNLIFAELQSVKSENAITADSSMKELEAENKSEALIASKEIRPAPDAESSIKNTDKEQARNDTFIASDIVSESANNVAVLDKSLSEQSESTPLVAENINKELKQTVHGKVVDETGEPLVGVSIVEKGKQNGTVTNADGTFTLQLPTGDSSKLIASYIGYEHQEINPSTMAKTVALKQDNAALSEVVVVGYGTQKKSTVTGAVSRAAEGRVAGVSVDNEKSAQNIFGEKEFQAWCLQKADKNVCAGDGASVKVSFFIDENGKPSNIEYKKYSCEDAKKEMESLLASSPVWTKTNRKVTVTVKW